MNNIALYGAYGQHGKDLLKRNIFGDFNLKKIDEEDDLLEISASGIIVPISKTKNLISRILLLDETKEIINFSGIMSTTPTFEKEGISISNLHFMFGPGRTEGLKLISSGNISSSTEKIIENANKVGIVNYEVTKEQHDYGIAITQAMTHLFIILSGFSKNKSLIQDWRAPIGTIKDMIFENEIFIKLFDDLLLQIKQKGDLSKVFIDIVSKMSQKELEIFSTPNFNNVAIFFNKNELKLNEEMLELLENFSTDIVIDSIKKLRNL